MFTLDCVKLKGIIGANGFYSRLEVGLNILKESLQGLQSVRFLLQQVHPRVSCVILNNGEKIFKFTFSVHFVWSLDVNMYEIKRTHSMRITNHVW